MGGRAARTAYATTRLGLLNDRAGSAVPAAEARLRRAVGHLGNLTGRSRPWQCAAATHGHRALALPERRDCATLTGGGTVLGLVERVRAIMMTPRAEWPVVASESGDALAIRYIAILALIPALARLTGGWLIGGYTPFLSALIGAAVAYALSFVTVFVVALAVDLLAPKFGGQRGYSRALRLTTYSFTPVWLAGIVLLVPGASFLVVLRSLRIYLTWTGLPVLMQSPRGEPCPMSSRSRRCDRARRRGAARADRSDRRGALII